MVKMKRLLFLTMAIIISPACILRSTGHRIPDIATVGLKPGSTKSIAYFELKDWASGIQPSAYAEVFTGQLVTTGETEIRVFIHDGQKMHYAGALSDQLGLPEVKTIFIDLGKEKCVIGWISPTVRELYDFRIERVRVDSEPFEDTVKESLIEANLFIVPIQEDFELWNNIHFSGVQTSGSLQRGNDALGSWYEFEKQYDPPLDISSWYVLIPIQN
jgi:hypothetical protein